MCSGLRERRTLIIKTDLYGKGNYPIPRQNLYASPMMETAMSLTFTYHGCSLCVFAEQISALLFVACYNDCSIQSDWSRANPATCRRKVPRAEELDVAEVIRNV